MATAVSYAPVETADGSGECGDGAEKALREEPYSPAGELGYFTASDGWRLSYESWDPPSHPLRVEESGRFGGGHEGNEREKEAAGAAPKHLAVFLHGVNAR